MKITAEISQYPVFFERNRVFRVYRGGKLFHEFFGDTPEDSNYPEEWVASSVKALNKDSTDPFEGVSRIRGTAYYFNHLLEQERENMLGNRKSLDVLVKLLDSAIRLPVQVHPTKEFSRAHFSSNFGKAEMWLVLATRENACIYFGFEKPTTYEELVHAVECNETNPQAMENLLRRIPVKKGDVFFIPAGAVHAIGYGCMILEVQEPTDFTIQPEHRCGDYVLSDYEKYLGLPKDIALSCFDLTFYGEKAEQAGRKVPSIIRQSGSFVSEELIGPDDTDCFGVLRHRITNGSFDGLRPISICVVTDGEGTLSCGSFEIPVKRGDYFFIPYAAIEKNGGCVLKTDVTLELVECLPPNS
jgi:mannose-6-phosphate isomerase